MIPAGNRSFGVYLTDAYSFQKERIYAQIVVEKLGKT
jgi:hypothetical protein